MHERKMKYTEEKQKLPKEKQKLPSKESHTSRDWSLERKQKKSCEETGAERVET